MYHFKYLAILRLYAVHFYYKYGRDERLAFSFYIKAANYQFVTVVNFIAQINNKV